MSQPPTGVPSPPSANLDWYSTDDGKLIKEESRPEVYVIFGQSPFWIPSPEELFALGYTWADVQHVPDDAVEKLRRFPLDGTAVHERTREGTYYVFFDGRRHRMPNADTLRWVRGTTTGVGRVPLGGLARFPEVVFDSAACTPPSVVYPPDNDQLYFALATPGTKRLVARGRELRIIELRGWLRGLDRFPEIIEPTCHSSDPDWLYNLELDPVWTRQRGINPNHVLKVGNIIEHGKGPLLNKLPGWDVASIPVVHLEVHGWPIPPTRREWLQVPTRPVGWSDFQRGCVSTEGRTVSWPFDPLNPTGSAGGPLQVGDYVRVVGSLVTDHRHGDYYWKGAWADGKWHTDRNDPARWTEIHSPDTIAPIRQGEPGWRPKVEQYWGVAVVAARSGWWEVTQRAIDVVLPPPPARLAGTTRLAVQEMVGAETNIETIVQGNPTRTGALLQVLSNGVRVRITVRGIQWGPLGKFKAIYRLYWV